MELPYPVDVAAAAPVYKLMGSDGFGRAAVGTTVKEPVHRDFDRHVTLAGPSIGRFSTIHGDKDVSCAVHAKSLVEDKSAATKSSGHNDLLTSFKDDVCLKPLTGYTKIFQLPGGEERQLQFKSGRLPRSNGKCAKRARITREEESSSSRITDAHELGDIANKSLTKSASLERSQSGKQRNIGSKRSDKRNFKVPQKFKNDYFPVKGCSSISNLSTAGSTVIGLYGLKSESLEVSEPVDDLPLNEILEGTFNCPILGKEKGKKAINSNESIIQSVRKVCSMLRPVKSSKSQNLSDLDNSGDKKVYSSLLSSASLEESGVDGDCGDLSTAELSSSNEDSYGKSEVTPVHPLDKPLNTPLDLFKKLTLPVPKDLDSLLLDAAKPIPSSRNASDLRLGKQILARRGGLPPFPWSNAFNGHSRTNSDAAKLHSGRVTCPGKWVKMKNSAALFRSDSNGFTDLDSITYDQRLVPCGKVETSVLPKSKSAAHESPAVPASEWGLSSSAACSFASAAPFERREELEHQQQANQPTSVTAAAQTLCEIATSSLKKRFDKTKWPKKLPSQKAMKARKLKLSSTEPEELRTGPPVPNGLLVNSDRTWPAKKPKLSTERCFVKAPISWATARSNRSSPSRLVRESISETKLSIVNITKPRKLMLPDWNKGKREGLQ